MNQIEPNHQWWFASFKSILTDRKWEGMKRRVVHHIAHEQLYALHIAFKGDRLLLNEAEFCRLKWDVSKENYLPIFSWATQPQCWVEMTWRLYKFERLLTQAQCTYTSYIFTHHFHFKAYARIPWDRITYIQNYIHSEFKWGDARDRVGTNENDDMGRGGDRRDHEITKRCEQRMKTTAAAAPPPRPTTTTTTAMQTGNNTHRQGTILTRFDKY